MTLTSLEEASCEAVTNSMTRVTNDESVLGVWAFGLLHVQGCGLVQHTAA